MEYWLKAFVSGIPHKVFLDVEHVPYTPMTGLMVAQGSGEDKQQRIDGWTEVVLTMVQDGLSRDAAQGEGRTTWRLHCPKESLREIVESEEVLHEKLRVRCGELYEHAMDAETPLIRFVTEEEIPCNVCHGESD